MSKQYVFEVEVEDLDGDPVLQGNYCGCGFSTRIKRYGLYSSLNAGIQAVQDKEGRVIKEVLHGEDWMLSDVSLYSGSNQGATFTVQTHQELMFVIRVQKVEVHDESV